MANSLELWFRDDGRVGGPAYLDDNLQKQREEELRAVFNSRYGVNALTLELVGNCFFREVHNEEEVALNNMAKRRLAQMGIWRPGNEEAIVRALLKISTPKEIEYVDEE